MRSHDAIAASSQVKTENATGKWTPKGTSYIDLCSLHPHQGEKDLQKALYQCCPLIENVEKQEVSQQ